MQNFLKKTKNSIVVSTTLLIISLVSRAEVDGPAFKAGQDPKPEGMHWQLLEDYSDEFNGDALNTNKWQQDPVGNGWGWIGRPPGLFSKDAVVVKDGKLHITASVLPKPVERKGKTFLYQGAAVRSIKPARHGWYFEAKMKANRTEMSSTFWLMSKNTDCTKKVELDIQENIGVVSDLAEEWAKQWHRIFHSNAIHRHTKCQKEPVQKQGQLLLDEENWQRYFVYAAWWKSPTEIQFFLDGKYAYTINPSTEFDVPMWLHMVVETYDWNPVPKDGGRVAKAPEHERITSYDWVRVWKLSDN
ncbi:glycosyl hydrolase [Agaribacter marinus]|uniref:GH16 domain-containing protein n=1 Tax=Agaribacter marinus TaxID=1431249 RepID=A0AA37SY88_9ALTE|nr:glycosyl hydrolase [Agaribacter marinus]GLR70539.1 hypothetical protein GCM10007852_14470 [Agaribacter marinus]